MVDPLVSLRPGGPNARKEGTSGRRPAAQPGQPPAPVEIQELKWTEATLPEYGEGKLPMGKAPDEWSFGDVEAGFKNAALVLDETFVTPNTSHQTLEPRSALAYWQNGKLYVHAGRRARCRRWPPSPAGCGWTPKTSSSSASTPAAASAAKRPAHQRHDSGAAVEEGECPVMHRITRDEEHSIGGARPSLHGRAKVGFDKEGRITAIDLFVIGDNHRGARRTDRRGLGGLSPNGCHVNVVLATAAARPRPRRSRCSAHPSPGHSPVLCCVGESQPEYQPIWPPTLMMNKATATTPELETMTWGAGQLGIGQAVLDAVAAGLIEASGDLIVLVAIWLDGRADDETAVREAARTAVGKALRMAVEGRDPAAAAALVESRDTVKNPFYGGD